ncbi:MAG: hypothetical protein HQL31_09680, partial [Planctomycetes bacterium]|nr:hypothetical protein [Planctomycetota bacterium]
MLDRSILSLLPAILVLLLSMACAKGTDTLDTSIPSVNAAGEILQPYIRDSFAYVPGGSYVPGVPEIPSNFDSADLSTINTVNANEADTSFTNGETAVIRQFLMMDTEVTIQMYAEFLNAVLLEDNESSSSGGSSGSEYHDNYRAIMQDSGYVGIFPVDAEGGRVLLAINEVSGFVDLTKPLPTVADGAFVDPYRMTPS